MAIQRRSSPALRTLAAQTTARAAPLQEWVARQPAMKKQQFLQALERFGVGQLEKKKQRKREDPGLEGRMGVIGEVVGGIIGGIYGGPMGAQMGSQMGRQTLGSIGAMIKPAGSPEAREKDQARFAGPGGGGTGIGSMMGGMGGGGGGGMMGGIGGGGGNPFWSGMGGGIEGAQGGGGMGGFMRGFGGGVKQYYQPTASYQNLPSAKAMDSAPVSAGGSGATSLSLSPRYDQYSSNPFGNYGSGGM